MWVWRRQGGIIEAAKGPKELVVIESVNQESKRMEEAIANHVFQGKEKDAIDRTLSWLKQIKSV